ncbi:hypothetical protein [Methylobacillus flagellatus]|uniref:hypothetical protein n=1 Tax=Methylobacillus flagellatus TaxID=405 RepID=UPI000039DEF0|nr:hypothetical protein [Methylobacillus flagellatus]
MKTIQILAVVGLGVGAFLLLTRYQKKTEQALFWPTQYAPSWSDNITGNNATNNNGVINV